MTVVNYRSLALSWVPDSQETRAFYFITAIIMLLALLLAAIISLIDVPPKERRVKQVVPERVAKFINEKKQAEPPKPTAQPRPTPLPIPSPKPRVVRKKESEAEKQKPLTQQEQQAREKAAQSGLLALGNELADLIDTSDVDALVGSKVRKSSASAQKVAGIDTEALTASAAQGSGGVATSDYVSGISTTTLDQREVALVRQSLVKSDDVAAAEQEKSTSSGLRTGNVRSEEEVTIVFDQNKGQLFSLYNRERRKKPGLKGKLVLEITIAPDGSVTGVNIASSELNDPALERRIVARVKNFKFAAKNVEPVTVTFPIEFLPS